MRRFFLATVLDDQSFFADKLVAEALALLADGAMYLGDFQAGMGLFEASRRVMSRYVSEFRLWQCLVRVVLILFWLYR